VDRLEQVSAEPRARWRSTLDRAGIKRADLVFCLSLANLVVLALWFHLSTLTDPGMYYYRDHAPDIALYGYGALAAVLGTVGLAVLFLCAAAAARVWGGVRSRRVMGAVVCGLLIVAVHAISTKVELPSRIVSALTGLLVILAAARTFRRAIWTNNITRRVHRPWHVVAPCDNYPRCVLLERLFEPSRIGIQQQSERAVSARQTGISTGCMDHIR
jgi:hypothetical protein